MECRQVRRVLLALLDGELSPQAREQVDAHLRRCPDCRRLYDQYRQDQVALSQHLRVAPWLPFEQRPWEYGERAPRRGFWSALLASSHKLGAAAALVALLALVTVSGLALRHMGTSQSGDPGNLPTVGVGATGLGTATPVVADAQQERQDYFDHLFAPLEAHGLVYDINQQVEIDGQPLTLVRLAVDRNVSYLEYVVTAGAPITAQWAIYTDREHNSSSPPAWGPVPIGIPPVGETNGPPPELSNWVNLPGLNPEAESVTIEITPQAGEPIDVTVPVDLAAIRALPAPQPLHASVTANGIAIEALSLTRGVAISTLSWKTTVVDQSALVPGLPPTSQSEQAWKVEVDGTPIEIVGKSGTFYDDGWDEAISLLGLPTYGTLTLTIDWTNTQPASSDEVARGPWTLTINLDNLDATAPTTPAPSVTAVPTAPPVQTPPATPRPVTPTPTPRPTLPAELYFLAQTPGGTVGLWARSADNAGTRVVIQDANSDVEAFWLMPSINTIAYRLAGDEQVLLFNTTTGQQTKATTPDGRPVVEYAPSPDGTQFAMIPSDRQSLVVATAMPDGRLRGSSIQVNEPAAETIHLVRWSPDGSKIGFEIARIAGNSLLRVSSATTLDTLWQASRPALTWDWSPDGSALVYASYGRIARVDLASGMEPDLTPERLKGTNHAILNIRWLRDGRIAYVVHDDPTVYTPAWLWLMNNDGSDAWRVREIGAADDVIWTPPPGRDGDVGFVVGTIDSGTSATSTASLVWYPTLHADPVPLAPDIDSRQFGSLRWGE